MSPLPSPRPDRDPERGNILLLVALLLPVLLAFAGAAVDVSNACVVRSMLQRAADDGVLSAQRWSTQVDDAAGADVSGIEQGAVAEALEVAQHELAAQGLGTTSTVDALPAGASLTITARARVRTFFLGLFGLAFWNVAVRSDGALWTPGAGLPAAGGPPPGPVIPGFPAFPEAAQGGAGNDGQNGGAPGLGGSASDNGPPGGAGGQGSTDANQPDSGGSMSGGGGAEGAPP